MAGATPDRYDLQTTALLHVDPYNDFISEGGKLWESCSKTIEGVELLKHTRELLAAAEQAGIVRFILPHRRWRPGDYDLWGHSSPSQRAIDAVRLFAAGEWGGEFREEFAPGSTDVVVHEHWAASGFANTDLGAFSWDEMNATFDLNAPTYAHAIVTTAELVAALGGPAEPSA